ncbi:MAG: trehalase family glycosidase, partial [Anaerolineales bacterium]
DIHFLEEIYDPLVRCNAWWFSSDNRDKAGLVHYSHPYSSGLDNSPLWDFGLPVISPDINTYLCIQMECLAVIAAELGNKQAADSWRQQSQQLAQRMVDQLWDEKGGSFQALHNNNVIPSLTPFNLYPLWTGLLPQEIVQRLIHQLLSPELFWGAYPLSTVAKSDPAFDAETMWRGPVWANINYFFIEALEKVGEVTLSHELRDNTLDLIMNQPDIREYYNAETGIAPTAAAPMFAWTASVFIDLALHASADAAKIPPLKL